MKYLEIEKLCFKRDNFSMQISFGLEKGETGIILGPSGGGKTTLLRCIAGLEKMDSGALYIDGVDFTNLPPEKRNFGFVFQDLALFDNRTGRGNIEFGLNIRGIDRHLIDVKVASLAKRLKIEKLLDRKPWTMSGGEKQRLAFARSIAFSPSLLLLDEPLSSLDGPLRKELRQFLYDTLKSESITSLHVTHDVEEAFELGDIIHIVKDGSLIASDRPEALYKNPPTAWCAQFLNLGSIFSIEGLEPNGASVKVITPYFSISCPRTILEHSSTGNIKPWLHEESESYFFIPREAVQISCKDCRGGEEHLSSSVLSGKIVRSHFMGEKKRIHVEIPVLDSERAIKNSQGETLLTLDADATEKYKPGNSINLAIDGRKCRILKP
jgi:ABC-type sugar transport system ATPase subunit